MASSKLLKDESLLRSLPYIINHVFLPPELPQEDDRKQYSNDRALIKEVTAALVSFQTHYVPFTESSIWETCAKMVKSILELRSTTGVLLQQKVEEYLQNMNGSDVLLFEIRAQNAALIIRRTHEHFIFESFELSPTNNSLFKYEGRLVRSFPGPSIALAHHRIGDASFRKAVATLLTQLDSDTPQEARERVTKSNSEAFETRNTVSPALVTNMLTGILRALGEPCEVVRIYKCTRDDVLWKDALKPWRRSPLWLLLRVALQTTLRVNNHSSQAYKSFMVYFMGRILKRALAASYPSDKLFIMSAKISRRLLKLAITTGPDWMTYVQGVVEETHKEIRKRWRAIEQDTDPLKAQQKWRDSPLSFNSDTALSLNSLRPYLNSIRSRRSLHLGKHPFAYSCSSPSFSFTQIKSANPEIVVFGYGSDHHVRHSLMEAELWVQDSLKDWLGANLSSTDTCTFLGGLIQNYTRAASAKYKSSPEDMSLMILTALDLWIALDKCTTYHYPLLKKYDTGFPVALFDPLLLPKKIQMQRLHEAESYLQQRRRASQNSYSLVLADINKSMSFGVQFFDGSTSLQDLKSRIEAAASKIRAEKLLELSQKKQEYNTLAERINSLSCKIIKVRDGNTYRDEHDHHGCEKCSWKRQKDEITIDVHEWPIPDHPVDAKALVFELKVPAAISWWRDVTYSLLVDVFTPQADLPSPQGGREYNLRTYDGLSAYMVSRSSRVGASSKNKPFVNAHYRTKKINEALASNICVNNGLRYSMIDSEKNQPVSNCLGKCDVRAFCTFQLPRDQQQSTKQNLQYVLDGTTHTSNDIISKQSECPSTLTLHAFYEFAILRSGHRLQWLNIATELVARVLGLNSVEEYMLIAQAAWQAGPLGSGNYIRESHLDLEVFTFGMDLLDALENSLKTIEGSWQNSMALRVLILLASRLLSLSLTSQPEVQNRCCIFLRCARKIVLRWTREVAKVIEHEHDSMLLDDMNRRGLEIALTCHSTFDVDQSHFPKLIHSSEDVSIFIECCITIHDLCPAKKDDSVVHLRLLLWRYDRLSHFIELHVRTLILEDQEGIDKTLGQVWEGYRPGTTWTAMEKPSERWLFTNTSSEGFTSNTVHYNILTGLLLVNGAPLTRLPKCYEAHATYRRLFKNKVLRVVPSTMKNMTFETRNTIDRHQIHFRIIGSELIIRTELKGHVCEVVPITAMEGDFPTAFIHEYVHILHVKTGEIEWRSLHNPWTPLSENWRLTFNGNNTRSLTQAPKQMIDIRSATATNIFMVLEPLEDASHVHITLDCQTRVLEVHLPRLKLNFFVEGDGKLLKSRQFRGMSIDERQSFGAFTGLRNKLVLYSSATGDRCVIVPHGEVTFAEDSSHVLVSIAIPEGSHVKYHVYNIDKQLGRLTDNGNLHSRLFRLYLHATTSHCLPDELTRRTGTEEALAGLAGAATRSFTKLKREDLELLDNLACLTPRREYYPQHLEVMQSIHWNALSPLSQSCRFNQEVAQIIQYATDLQIFQVRSGNISLQNKQGEPFLMKKAALRDSSFQVYDSLSHDLHSIPDYDGHYNSRDRVSNNLRELQTCRMAKLVDTWSQDLADCSQLLSEMESWSKNSSIRGPGELQKDLNIGFNVRWLDEDFSKLLRDYWFTLQDKLSMSVAHEEKYNIMMLLSCMSYSSTANQELVRTLFAFATLPELRSISPPCYAAFNLQDGYKPVQSKLNTVVKSYRQPSSRCPESTVSYLPDESYDARNLRIETLCLAASLKEVSAFVADLMSQSGTDNVRNPAGRAGYSVYIQVKEAMIQVRPLFESWHRNYKLKQYTQRVQKILDKLHSNSTILTPYNPPMSVDRYTVRKTHVQFADLLNNPAPCLPSAPMAKFEEWVSTKSMDDLQGVKLRQLLDETSTPFSSLHKKQYCEDLNQSYHALQDRIVKEIKQPTDYASLLQVHLDAAQIHVKYIFDTICERLQSGRQNLMLPRLSPVTLLSNLAGRVLPNKDWTSALVKYGLAITTLQKAERLVSAADNLAELLRELQTPGYQGWDPFTHPEWLLLEIENNILIREEQAQIAAETISPSSKEISVVQLNMGLGKSSVIVPMSAIALADTNQLVRVIVLKPLAMQMLQLLLTRLGGMINRRVYYMPICRSLQLSVQQVQKIKLMYEDCMKNGDILLTQPEHILSFELMGLETSLTDSSKLGTLMTETQKWLYSNSRDILDESDEILSVRFELIYTIGLQRSIDYSPKRWSIIQYILGLTAGIASDIHSKHPEGLEVIHRLPNLQQGLPRLRMVQIKAGEELLSLVARRICEEGLPGLPVHNLPPRHKATLLKVLTKTNVKHIEMESLMHSVSADDSMKSGLLLLKGLISNEVLRFVFETKRWRVNYGLDPSRTMLSVPYHAKDNPSPRAEFSHPDATIVMTCLSYYYGGLTLEQVRESFQALFLSDQAQEKYESWVEDAPALSPQFRHIDGVNLEDIGQCLREVFPPLQLSKGAIDFYLATIVFPKHMKEFPDKLSSSGWDIAREKRNPTTGFSGTNDSRYVLPLSITQRDLPAQLSTNAEVLDCLLQSENTFADIRKESPDGTLNAYSLLNMVVALKPPVRVILDVGAQVLELHNEEVAREWLKRMVSSEAQAVIFFDSQNELCVLSRDGSIEPLLVSPFSKQMDQCLVYLDESHTRGVDLRLPTNYRALVTLGPNLTKDRLVQACMRMRKLGKGQSVVFCSSIEVQQKIRASIGRNNTYLHSVNGGDGITVADVLKWSIAETCASTKKNIPLWATQGLRHQHRRAVCSEAEVTKSVVQELLEPEAKTLQQRYDNTNLHLGGKDEISQIATSHALTSRPHQVRDIRSKCVMFEVMSFENASMLEEQERELSPENEHEQEVEVPPKMKPLQHSVHPDVQQIATHALLKRNSSAFLPAFSVFNNTTAKAFFERMAWSSELLVTADFAKTVKIASSDENLDYFLRPVRWVVSCRRDNVVEFVILSPFEAQELLPFIRSSNMVHLHVYSPRVSKSMRTLEDLSYCAIPSVAKSWCIPPIISHQLNLFAGQLYIRSYDEYVAVCSFLGICSQQQENDVEVASDGFIVPSNLASELQGRTCTFQTSPVSFLNKVMAIRRKGEGISVSHVGKILNGELLQNKEF